MPTDIRPLTFGELLDLSFAMYRKNFALFAGIAVLPSIAAIPIGLTTRLLDTPQAGTPATGPNFGFVAGILVTMGSYWLFYMVGLAAATFAVSEIYLGRSTTVREAYRKAQERVGSL